MKTVKVRIAVSVDPKGNWGSSGSSGQDEAEAHSWTVDLLQDGEARYWIEAELPVPEIATVQATVIESTP